MTALAPALTLPYLSGTDKTKMSTQERHKTAAVDVGGVTVGGGAPIVVQSMTNTDTADVEGTARQVAALARAGSELVRITVDRDEAAAAVPHIKERLAQMGVAVPIVGDFHYIGHKLLADHPGLRRGARQIPHQSRQCRLQGQDATAVLRRSSRWRSSTASRCASASTGARSTRSCSPG